MQDSPSFLPTQANHFYALVSLSFTAATVNTQRTSASKSSSRQPSRSFTPTRSRTVPCPGPPCGPSTMTLACCCKGPARSGRSGWAERGAEAPGVRWNTAPFPAPSAPPWAAAPWALWGTRAELERPGHNLQPSNLCRSSWNISKLFRSFKTCLRISGGVWLCPEMCVVQQVVKFGKGIDAN